MLLLGPGKSKGWVFALGASYWPLGPLWSVLPGEEVGTQLGP